MGFGGFAPLRFAAIAAAVLGLCGLASLAPILGAAVLAAAALGYALAAGATLAAFAAEIRDSRRGRPAFRGVGLGFVAKLLLLAGGTVAGRFAGLFDGTAYAVGFLAGFAAAGVPALFAAHRVLASRGRGVS